MHINNEIRKSAQKVGENSRRPSHVLRASPNITAIGDTLSRLHGVDCDESESLFGNLLLRLKDRED